ncbi:hypothetical protein GIB67_006125 [Kingdonia uniflora]|uniref:Uncharacterized protein n=1 Tax=Kingdonia uniflora TaxID=39325 RepID=A0A7J7LPT5_9MAGN|nr:hypothetical protein GIB67_006125 [Kingdonia uniflora]
MSWQRDTSILSSSLIEDHCYLDLFLSPLSLSPLVACGACVVLLLIAIRVWWSISGLECSYIDCASLWF